MASSICWSVRNGSQKSLNLSRNPLVGDDRVLLPGVAAGMVGAGRERLARGRGEGHGGGDQLAVALLAYALLHDRRGLGVDPHADPGREVPDPLVGHGRGGVPARAGRTHAGCQAEHVGDAELAVHDGLNVGVVHVLGHHGVGHLHVQGRYVVGVDAGPGLELVEQVERRSGEAARGVHLERGLLDQPPLPEPVGHGVPLAPAGAHDPPEPPVAVEDGGVAGEALRGQPGRGHAGLGHGAVHAVLGHRPGRGEIAPLPRDGQRGGGHGDAERLGHGVAVESEQPPGRHRRGERGPAEAGHRGDLDGPVVEQVDVAQRQADAGGHIEPDRDGSEQLGAGAAQGLGRGEGGRHRARRQVAGVADGLLGVQGVGVVSVEEGGRGEREPFPAHQNGRLRGAARLGPDPGQDLAGGHAPPADGAAQRVQRDPLGRGHRLGTQIAGSGLCRELGQGRGCSWTQPPPVS